MSFSIKLFILLCMIFCHIVDDYYLQGVLATMKQKRWWLEKYPDRQMLYKHDYVVALIVHAFSWSFMINVPILFVSTEYFGMCYMIVFNTLFHAYIDNIKANKQTINLIRDQLAHLVQIVGLWAALVVNL